MKNIIHICIMIEEFRDYLKAKGVDFVQLSDGVHPVFMVGELAIILVSLSKVDDLQIEHYLDCGTKRIFLYEDRWNFNKDYIKKRLDSHIGRGKSIYARNGKIVDLNFEQAKSFLDKNHSYGAVKSKYYYGFYYKDQLLAVSVFSAPRDMNRDGVVVASYEWVRYASLPDLRVVGGMDKFLKYFLKDIEVQQNKPIEIMSYADREWSEGQVYEKLGFIKDSNRPPIEFLVNNLTMERISVRKIYADKKYRTLPLEMEKFYKIKNLGSIKFLYFKR